MHLVVYLVDFSPRTATVTSASSSIYKQCFCAHTFHNDLTAPDLLLPNLLHLGLSLSIPTTDTMAVPFEDDGAQAPAKDVSEVTALEVPASDSPEHRAAFFKSFSRAEHKKIMWKVDIRILWLSGCMMVIKNIALPRSLGRFAISLF